MISSGIDYSFKFSVPIFSFDSIKKFTQSQAVFLQATLALLLSWLVLCLVLRFGKINDGRSLRFRLRWWISRLDVCYATRHWLDDQKVVKKRKTELGGTFSIASWILFIGLFAALLYQIISRRSVEVHNVRASNGPDLLSFINDMEFNITTISSMSCSHLRGLGTLVTGTPGFIDYRSSPLSIFANYSCHNTSQGPTVMLRCSNCKIARDDLYISWQFVDLPNSPATAVGFQFNFTAKNLRDRKRISFVTGTLNNGSNMDNRPITFRGPDVNILKFHLFPRMYHNLHGLRLIQPLFHEFIPGSSFLGTSQLQASLQSSQDGLINTTLAVNFLSAYIIEIDTENVLGPVSVLADLGGLYAISFAIFFYILMQCEFRIKKLRREDTVLINIRNRTKAKQNWDKLRKYVMYTWDCSSLEDVIKSNGEVPLCDCMGVKSSRESGSLHKRKQEIQMDTVSLNKKGNLPTDMSTCCKLIRTEKVKSCSTGQLPDIETGLTCTKGEHVTAHEDSDTQIGKRSKDSTGSCQGDVSQPRASLLNDMTLPLPPVLEYKTDSGSDVLDVQRNLQNLFEYNVLLREKFIASQSKLEALTKKASDPHCKCHNIT
ncbi:Transmembrane protein [Thalictrum thalictroides]|uniref:Transmembrane protein n=1 Tax=Thalictrum thalictroides TaxID=46969 RepID=A0A7J6XCS6_THATH|nr:Transmembrane protein [Thalictrum thalictroides]